MELSASTVIARRLVQPANAEFPMLVTPFPRSEERRCREKENALSPMLVTLLGMVTLVRPVQSRSAESPMLVTLPGIVYLPVLASGHRMSRVWLLLNKTPSTML